jgi:mannose-6-phosphate isomerase-like protein (cupin superfamily)
MRDSILAAGVALLVFVPPVLADDMAKDMSHDAGGKAITINAKDLKWGEAPPDLPKGAKIAVLFGDPTKEGPFTVRLKAPDGYKIAPHWHSKDEQLTVISGTLILHMGDTMKADPHRLSPGAFHYLPGKMHHAAETKGATIVQVTGEGPFDIHYLNESDNPNTGKTAKK